MPTLIGDGIFSTDDLCPMDPTLSYQVHRTDHLVAAAFNRPTIFDGATFLAFLKTHDPLARELTRRFELLDALDNAETLHDLQFDECS